MQVVTIRIKVTNRSTLLNEKKKEVKIPTVFLLSLTTRFTVILAMPLDQNVTVKKQMRTEHLKNLSHLIV